ncbi:MAG: recombinase family protein [Neisseriaceae bacterium]|nr:MAG: recombinase family protein [Neisseriaceae bacterium]
MTKKSTGKNIGYVRVSTVEQNTSRQLEEISLDKKFIDKCSGKDTNRPSLQLMLDYVRDGDIVYVHSMDRLARNLEDLRKIISTLAEKKVKIHFVKESLIFNGEDSPMANFMLNIMGAFAEFERALIRERQKEGIAIAKKDGKYHGRSKCLTSEQLQEIKQLVADRYKKTEIAERFGISRDTLYRYLRNNKSQ